MANKDFEKMIKLGEWLERYLNLDTKYWEYRQLAHDFIDLYQVNHGITKNEITLKIIDTIESQAKEIRDYYKKGHIASIEEARRFIYSKKDPLKLLNIVEQVAREQYSDEEDVECFVYPLRLRTISVYQYKEFVNHALQLILSSQKPWAAAIIDLDKKQTWTEIRDESSGDIIKTIEPEIPQTIFGLSDNYKKIFDVLKINKSDSTISLQKQFDMDGHHFSKEYVLSNPDCEKSSHFPWEIAASRAFFDFLFLGGQEYFLFCKHCGKFTVIRRKGRKKFCSDICRTNYGRQKSPA